LGTIRKSAKLFSLATNAGRVCAEIMPKQAAISATVSSGRFKTALSLQTKGSAVFPAFPAACPQVAEAINPAAPQWLTAQHSTPVEGCRASDATGSVAVLVHGGAA